jgi:hypothetical protein
MHLLDVNCSRKGQMKIQQMAFMLVATVIFFSMVGLIYFSITLTNLRTQAEDLRKNEAREIVKSISRTPELSFTSTTTCSQCLDLDKALLLKDLAHSGAYENFWDLDYLEVEIVYPHVSGQVECTRANYPNCNKLVIINKTENFGLASSAFVSLARWDPDMNDFRYEFGRIHASGENLNG